ncbi:thioredoxin-like protein [Coprinellus micaceus]|uniref:Thioredoxin-like protein n=1 Tax=Coprinellus micaceus TaxID=71717 RepID=A0A4Y7SWE2_COPMI|nr:thioredoxin-like protein [Coprinellus micaceus]
MPLSALRLASKRASSFTNALRTSSARSIRTTVPRAALYAQADEKTFKQVIEAKGRVVLVDFYADWCGPCHQLSPVIESLTAEPHTSGSGLPLDLIKVNTDTDEGIPLAQAFKVTALPTVIAFKDGVPVSQFKGALPPAHVKKFIESL